MNLKRILEVFAFSIIMGGNILPLLTYAEDHSQGLPINMPNGIAGLNENKEIVNNIDNQSIDTQNIDTQNLNTQNLNTQNLLSQSLSAQFYYISQNGQLRISTGSDSPSDTDILIFYNRESRKGDDANNLQSHTMYFTGGQGDDHYRFKGDIVAFKYTAILSTPSSSSAPCHEGEFQDDANYHYVCVATNKWKRVALSDF